MRRCTILILAMTAIAMSSHAIRRAPANFSQRALAAISTPELHPPGEQRGLKLPAGSPIQNQNDDARLHRSPWSGNAANQKRVGLGLTIAGIAVCGLGAGILIADANNKERNSFREGSQPELDIIGRLLILFGTALIIPGIIMLLKS